MNSKIEVSRELLERCMRANDEAQPSQLYADLRSLLGDVPVIDLDVIDWETIQRAADESNWMPNEYMRNEWVSDVCNFLKYGRPNDNPERSSLTEAAPDLLEALQSIIINADPRLFSDGQLEQAKRAIAKALTPQS